MFGTIVVAFQDGIHNTSVEMTFVTTSSFIAIVYVLNSLQLNRGYGLYCNNCGTANIEF